MYTMTFHDWWRIATPETKRALAEKVHVSTNYLSQVAHGHHKPSRRLVDLIGFATGEKLEFENCCQD